MNSSLPLRTLFLQHVAQTSPFPPMLEVEKALGVFIFDTQGKRYIDFISGISVSNVGHCNPHVIKAIQKQAEQYMHVMVYGEFVQSPQVKLAQAIISVLPESLNSVYFVNSGSEATEGALKLAKRLTGRTELISFKNAYHGSSHGALSVMGSEVFKQAYRPLLPDVRILNYNDFDSLDFISSKTAAVIVEPIQGEAGAYVPDSAWLIALRNKCTEMGTILIFDEIQTGFGRTGAFFAREHSGVVPDIILMAKGMGGGLPIGAFVASKEHMLAFTHQPILGHITTFGGNAVCGLCCGRQFCGAVHLGSGFRAGAGPRVCWPKGALGGCAGIGVGCAVFDFAAGGRGGRRWVGEEARGWWKTAVCHPRGVGVDSVGVVM
jgi:acetylornithine/succinyldiaminopimelate/putrescine aminotransferase